MIGNLEVRSPSVAPAGLHLTSLTLAFEAVVYNPNPFGTTLDGANYSISANGHFLGDGRTAHEYRLAPRSSQTLTFPVMVGWKPMFGIMGNYVVNLGKVSWTVKGTAIVQLGGVSIPTTFEFTTG